MKTDNMKNKGSDSLAAPNRGARGNRVARLLIISVLITNTKEKG